MHGRFLAVVLAVVGPLVAESAAGAGPVELRGAWVRALPPSQATTAAYLVVANRGAAPVLVTGASSDVAARVELHQSREVDGYLRMERLEELEVPAGGEVTLAPGGTHLMLLDLEHMPAEGEQVGVCLTLATGAAVCTTATVRRTAAEAATHDHHHHHQD